MNSTDVDHICHSRTGLNAAGQLSVSVSVSVSRSLAATTAHAPKLKCLGRIRYCKRSNEQ